MMKLTDLEWKEFSFTDIFEIKKGFYNKKPNRTVGANIPFLGATDSNNGVTNFLTLSVIEKSSKTGKLPNEPLERKLFPGHAIAVTNNGSVGHAYYQAREFTCSHDINPLYLKDHTMSKLEALFLIPLIEQQGKLFQYARKWRPSRMVSSKIMLPVDDKDQPDYQFMADYEKNLIHHKQEQYLTYVKQQLSSLGDPINLEQLIDKKWAPFFLNEVFDVNSGVRLTNQDKENGKKPFIGATDNGNGITGFVGNTNKSQDSNVLGVNYNGAPGIAFYHPYTALFSDDVKRLKLKDESHNTKNVLLFMASIVMKQRGKYSYGYKFNASRMNRQKLYLPVDNQGQPDFDYMEQYIKNKMIQKYKKYLEYLGK